MKVLHYVLLQREIAAVQVKEKDTPFLQLSRKLVQTMNKQNQKRNSVIFMLGLSNSEC